MHLPGVTVLEGAGLEIDEQVAAEDAVVEDEVEVVVLVAHRDAFLAGLEAEAGAEFEKEGLEVVEQRLLQVGFEIMGFLGEPGEFEDVGGADEIGDDLGDIGRQPPAGVDDRRFVGGESGAFVEQRADLALELTLGPVALEAFVFAESALPRIVQPDKFCEVGPGQFQQLQGGKRSWFRFPHHR